MAWVQTSDGIRIRYDLAGPRHGEPLLLVQGLGADSRGWLRQRRHFARRGYRVITFDNRGVGRSDKPFGTYSLERMALISDDRARMSPLEELDVLALAGPDAGSDGAAAGATLLDGGAASRSVGDLCSGGQGRTRDREPLLL